MFGNYSVSKTAAHAAMLAFALALEDTNIKVNAACPGFTSTGLILHPRAGFQHDGVDPGHTGYVAVIAADCLV